MMGKEWMPTRFEALMTDLEYALRGITPQMREQALGRIRASTARETERAKAVIAGDVEPPPAKATKGKQSKKLKTPEQRAAKTAKDVGVPRAQIANGQFALEEVSNRTDADQRHMMRSGEKNTVRRLTKIEKLLKAGTIERHEAQACEWYAEVHALGFDTIGCTANYGGAGGGGFGSHDLLARYKAQEEARLDYWFAREAIPAMFLPMFEAVVLEGKTMAESGCYAELARSQRASKLSAAFRMVANLLHGRIAHRLCVE